MSEEILKALTHLFAIITKQDNGVTEKERNFIISFFQQELDQNSVKEYIALYDKFVGDNISKAEPENDHVKVKKLTSVSDSVKTLALCKKFNKTLAQKQKIIVLIKILELVGCDKNFTSQRRELIDTISNVFNIEKEEYNLIEEFIFSEKETLFYFEEILIISSHSVSLNNAIKLLCCNIKGEIIFMKIRSVDLYFVKFRGKDENILNGFTMKENQVYLFSPGSIIKTPQGSALYYSDLISHFIEDSEASNISFNARNIEFCFANGEVGLHNINISEGPGKLIGIMGASGAGKTTLLNVLAGIEKPNQGEIIINGINLHNDRVKLQGVIGYISQDDLLIEELTVYQNLYYNAKLCYSDLKDEEVKYKVLDVLQRLGLEHRKYLKVGSILDKTISGGQRKRLNIALELIREPAILFVDEPTSGLSSRDSENVIDLLKELSLKGKLIFVVIHQPSSDIYKMFDRMFIMDTGGYPIFYGNPIEAITYFKKATNQVDSGRGQCSNCGNVNPEQIFNMVEAKVVDEYGQYTPKRKGTPEHWHEQYLNKFQLESVEDLREAPPSILTIPSRIRQSCIFTVRDFIAKISNKEYLLINLLEAPALAVILAFIIRYKNSLDGSSYMFRYNENIPAYMLMSIVVALFMGLTVSAEEIIRDRKILKRESFLNLSWSSYLVSKLSILFFISAIQTLSFVLIGNFILEIKEMNLNFWLVLFSVSCFANVLGLNISSAFNSAVTVYILIPLLLIPQMILSGLIFDFNKLNEYFSTKGKVPIVADLMASRWAYEAMAVEQFKSNPYEKPYFQLEMEERQSDYKAAYLISKLQEKLHHVRLNLHSNDNESGITLKKDLIIIREAILRENYRYGLEEIDLMYDLSPENYNAQVEEKLNQYLVNLANHYKDKYKMAVKKKEALINILENEAGLDYNLNKIKNQYYNESLADLVKNVNVKDRVIEYNSRLIQQIDPVYQVPEKPLNTLNYRAHFFAPEKYFINIKFNTYNFNIMVIWLMSFILFLTLYFKVLRLLISLSNRFRISKGQQG